MWSSPLTIALYAACFLGIAAIRDKTDDTAVELDIALNFLHRKAHNNSLNRKMHPLGDLPSGVGTALAMYNTFNNVMGLASSIASYRSVEKYSITTNILKNIDSLRDLHDTLVQKVGLVPPNWDATCDDCTPADLHTRYNFTTAISSGSFINTAIQFVMSWTNGDNAEGCPFRLKRYVALMRDVMVKLSKEGDELIAQLSEPGTANNDLPMFRFEDDRGCDGDCKDYDCDPGAAIHTDSMRDHLKNFHQPYDGNGLCRTLPPKHPRANVTRESQDECYKMSGCKGFTLYDGTLTDFKPAEAEDVMKVGDMVELQEWVPDFGSLVPSLVEKYKEEKRKCRVYPVVLGGVDESDKCEEGDQELHCGTTSLGCWPQGFLRLVKSATNIRHISNRVCFRTSVANEYMQEATECFKKPSDPLWAHSSAETAKWFQSLPAKGDGMQEAGMQEALMQAAEKIKAKELSGKAVMAMGIVKMEEYLGLNAQQAKRVMCMMDAVKGGASAADCWEDGTFEKYMKYYGLVDPYIFFGVKTNLGSTSWALNAASRLASTASSYLGQYAWLGKSVSKSLGVYLDVNYTVAYTQDLTGGTADWLTMAAAATALLKTMASVAEVQCPVVESWLQKTDLGDVGKLQQLVETQIK
mmetsp:Transcript_109361/g.193719  ORF Transcript_109361/g.193719 Transcript_109361/m.193719 type:complete len:638 (-) Transcript_109361:78-1991(-)